MTTTSSDTRTPSMKDENDTEHVPQSVVTFTAKTLDSFQGRFNPSILLQDANGPCPLIAIANVLLLSGAIQLPPPISAQIGGQENTIECEAVVQLLATHILSMISNGPYSPQNTVMKQVVDGCKMMEDEEERLKQEKINISEALDSLPQLYTGLIINPAFRDPSAFDPLPSLFEALNVPLYHAWVVDPKETLLCNALYSHSYNSLMERLVEGDSESPSSTPTSWIGQEFLNAHATQITQHGLNSLLSAMNTGQLCVLFRNNHFYTCYKQDDRLLTLVTDAGYAKDTHIVWETLEIGGNSELLDAQFKPSLVDRETNAMMVPRKEDTELLDAALAMSLYEDELREQQREEEERARQRSTGAASSLSGPNSTNSTLRASKLPSTGQQLPPKKRNTRSDKLCRIQ